MPDFSQGFKINVNKLNADESAIVLVEINHPLVSETIRIVRDTKDVLSNGNNYFAMAFDFKRQDDVQGEVPKVTLQIQNVGRSLVKWIDQSGGGKDAEIKALLIRRSNPDLVEESVKLQVERISINQTIINLNLVVQNNLIRRGIRYIYNFQKFPGLF